MSEWYNPRPGYTTIFFRLPFYFFNQAEEIEERENKLVR